MGPYRQGGLLTVLLAAVALAPAGCKKDSGDGGEPVVGEKVPDVEPGQVSPQAANPHGNMGGAGMNPHGNMGGAAGANPHGNMGGAPGGDPHGGMGMQGGGGSMLEKTGEGRAVLGPVTMQVPKAWQERATQGSMRAAEFAIPGKDGEAELIVYFFGAGGAGGVDANLQRWHGQFQGKDGAAVTPKTEKKEVAGMPVTLTEVQGHYVAAMMPGAPEKHDKPDHALLGAIVETKQGPYYFKLVGPSKTVAAIRGDFHALIDSIQPK